MELLNQIVRVDFIPLLTMVYLLIFMIANDPYEHKINQLFRNTLILLLFLTMSDNLDFYFSGLSTPHSIHKIIIMTGYITRVFALLSAAFIFKRNNITAHERKVLYAPAFVNALVILSAFFNDNVFWIDESNNLHRELLSYTPHAVCLIYFFYIFALAIKRFKQGYKDEAMILWVGLFTCMAGVILEIVLKTRGLLISAIALMMTFYYQYLHMEHFKRDNLTGTLNRMSFFADLKRYKNISALCEFDLNGLKQINDNYGHAKGDEAIINTANIILKCLPKNCYLYRLGGDEFAVLFCNMDLIEVCKVIENIRKSFEKSRYTCAIGMAEWKNDMSFTEIYNIADEKMYEDKRRQKSA